MPFAHDRVVAKSDAPENLLQMALEVTRENAREQMGPGLHPDGRLEAALARLGPEVLPLQLAHVFYAVKAQGTPMWFVHTKAGVILASKIGHMTKDEMLKWVEDSRNFSSSSSSSM
eukprot:scaffold28403_cov50-Attheya_sp.AAC.2